MSANTDGVGDFKSMLPKFIKDKGLTLSQVYNCDEPGLYRKALPSKMPLVMKSEHLGVRSVKKG